MPSAEQHHYLLQPPATGSLDHKDKFTYISHQAIRVNLNRIFGFGNWSFTTSDPTPVREYEAPTKSGRNNHHVVYRVTGRLDVTFDDGRTATFTETAVDKAQHPEYEQAHDNAVKGAASMALRRCAMNLGSPFGLGLYFDGNVGDVVTWTIDTVQQMREAQQ